MANSFVKKLLMVRDHTKRYPATICVHRRFDAMDYCARATFTLEFFFTEPDAYWAQVGIPLDESDSLREFSQLICDEHEYIEAKPYSVHARNMTCYSLKTLPEVE